MLDYEFHPEARDDYLGALAWYRERSARAAEGFEAEVDRGLARIVANPSMFPKYDEENRFALLRRFPFSIVYQAVGQRIIVVAVAHARREEGYWKSRT